MKRMQLQYRFYKIDEGDCPDSPEMTIVNIQKLINMFISGDAVFTHYEKMYKLPPVGQTKFLHVPEKDYYYELYEFAIEFELFLCRLEDGDWNPFAEFFFKKTTPSNKLKEHEMVVMDPRDVQYRHAIVDRKGTLFFSHFDRLFFFYIQQLINGNCNFRWMRIFHYFNGKTINCESDEKDQEIKGMIIEFKKIVNNVSIPIIVHRAKCEIDTSEAVVCPYLL
jgi:hypothetical protein